MEFKSNNTQPRPVRPVESNPKSGITPPTAPYKSKKHLAIVVVAVIAALLLLLTIGMVIKSKFMGAEKAIKSDKYQALFLTNGQVYFGRLKDIDHSYAKMSDIYYLQVQQSVQPQDKPVDQSQQPKVSLSKLGSELHGPEDAMQISRDQILFWENLKDDSKVVQAINEHKNK